MQKISVIVPVYKAEKFISKCVDSIRNQQYANLEIILVDDGSPDLCPKICDEYAKLDNRIKVIHQKNQGVAVARNAGLKAATGDYITFVDSDDYIDKQMYASMMKKAMEYNCDLVVCDCLKEFSDHTELYTHDIRGGFYDLDQLEIEYYPHLLIMENIEYPVTISNCLCLFKNKPGMFDEDGLFYEPGIRFSEDLLFGARLMRQAKSFYYMKGEAYYHYYMNEQSATHVYSPDKWDNYLRLYSKIKEHFYNNTRYDFKNQIDLCLLFFMYNTIGDIYSNSTLSVDEKQKEIFRIINETIVREMFERIKINNLQISWKQKIITFLYKENIGIKSLIKYMQRK